MTLTDAVVYTADDVADVPGEPLGKIEGVSNHLLWTDGTSMAGWMTVAAGHRLGEHAHRAHSHHMWVVEGSAEVLGKKLGPGAYVHVPPGVTHDIDARATEGCRVFYLYVL